jgi:hypothetical protein
MSATINGAGEAPPSRIERSGARGAVAIACGSVGNRSRPLVVGSHYNGQDGQPFGVRVSHPDVISGCRIPTPDDAGYKQLLRLRRLSRCAFRPFRRSSS